MNTAGSLRAAAADGMWAMGETFIVRVAGLPVESVHALRSPRTAAWADETGALEERLTGVSAALSDLLHDAIGETADDEVRKALVRLRRDVFNGRVPRDVAAARRTAASIAGAAGEGLVAWLTDMERLAAARLAGTEIMAAEMSQARAALRLLAVEPRLRQGLLLASPTLDAYLDSYANNAGELTKRQRRMERSLLEYVYRAACKTSPFSSFAGLGIGSAGGPQASEPGGLPSLATGDGWADYPRLNVAILGRVADMLLATDSTRMDLPVTIVSGWSQDPGRIRYVRRSVERGGGQSTASFDFVRESLLYLRRYPGISRVFELLEGQPRLRYSELLAQVAEASGAGPATADRFLQALVHLGLIQVPDLVVDIHSPDPVRRFRAAAASLGTPWAAKLSGCLDELAAIQDAYAAAGLAERRNLLAALRQRLAELPAAVGAPPVAFPQTVLYEDVRVDATPPGLDAALAGRISDSLRTLSAMAPAFDALLVHRLTLKGYFEARYGRGGRCDDLLGLVHNFHEEIYDQFLGVTSRQSRFTDDGRYVPVENWLSQPEMGAIDRARTEFVRRMRILAAGGADQDLVLDAEFVGAVAGELREVTSRFRPQSHFLQLARSGERTVAVLNKWWNGLGYPFTRFLHCFADSAPGGLAAQITSGLRAAQPPGTVFVELTGGFTTNNLNLHDRLTDFELVCPGETSSAPPTARIPLDDLYVEHDVPADRLVLRSTRLGKEVIPVYHGYVMPLALPEIPRTLMLFSPVTLLEFDVWAGVPAASDDGDMLRRPRVRCGDVVLSRRSWTTTTSALPARTPGADDSEWFLRWRDWRRRHGLPEQVFATLQPESGPGRVKPFYVDFASVLSLTVLDGMLGPETGRVVFEEMLPTADQAWVRSPRGRHVAELVIETTSLSQERVSIQ